MGRYCDKVFAEGYSMRVGEVAPADFSLSSRRGRRRDHYTTTGYRTGAKSTQTDGRDVKSEYGGDLEHVSFSGDGEAHFSIDRIDGMIVPPSAMDEFLSLQGGGASSNPQVELGNSCRNGGADGTQVGDASGSGGVCSLIPSVSPLHVECHV